MSIAAAISLGVPPVGMDRGAGFEASSAAGWALHADLEVFLEDAAPVDG